MSSAGLEAYLAVLYTDDAKRHAFLQAPHAQALLHGLSPQEADAMAEIDRIGLQMAAASFQHKRDAHGAHAKPRQGWWRRLLGRWHY
ncbi:hypothetical protein [Janthinobacterium sp. RB2R34]|uniref:hypothetical protein n=1 Tax=Janthinobacterium sp. RB2R34 TaxID=3424193 RepID=UPI003F23B5F5